MTEITRSGMCGNSPKNQLVEEMAIALITGNGELLLNTLAEEAVVRVIGQEDYPASAVTEGATAVASVKEVTVDHAISHGKIGAASGSWQTEDGQSFAFSDHYEFTSSKGTQIRLVSSYRIKL
ncbi:hypothetical protein [Paenibacillus sp. 1P07SE]|uniref:hypothetical protein n=1 Tax=Paenibacillus sp. 1P07SE TaxID=3132209 RepID=UPI0039A48400